jgi:hypothetical protein
MGREKTCHPRCSNPVGGLLYIRYLSQTDILWHVRRENVFQGLVIKHLLRVFHKNPETLCWQDDGVVARLLMPAGSKDIPVGTVLAVMVEDKESVPAFKDYSPSSSPGALVASGAPPLGGEDTGKPRLC